MSLASRVDAYQRRHRRAGLPLAVLYKFGDDQGTYLAAQITYYAFVAAFPLLLLLDTLLGYVLHGNSQLQQRVLDSALAQFPVVGSQVTADIRSFHGTTAGLVIGVVGCVYGGLGIVQAVQNMLNKVWGVPRNARPHPVRARVRSLMMLAFGGLSVVVTTVLTALASAADTYGASVDVGARVLASLAAVALNVTLFMVAFRMLTARRVAYRQIRDGAVAAAVIWQALQWAGTFLLGHKVKGDTATYGLFALVLGLVAWIYVGALVTVLCAEMNAVRAGHLWPRSLLAPFSDSSDGTNLTPADRRAYASYAETERHKTCEEIDVTFGDLDRDPDLDPDRDSEPGEPPPDRFDWAVPANLQPEPISVEVWRDLPAEFCQQVELVNGQVVRCEQPSQAHQAAAARVTAMLDAAAKAHMERNPGTRLDTSSDFDVLLWELPAATIRSPDAALFDGAPDDLRPLPAFHLKVVVEVVSPGSTKADKLDKMAEYADAGIPFYWLVWLSGDHVLSIDVHVLDHTLGYYRPHRTLTPEQEISTLDVPVRIQVDWSRLTHLARMA